MGSVRKVGKHYYVDYRDADGRRIRKSVGNAKVVAEQFLKKVEGEVATGKHGLAPNQILIAEFFTKYLQHIRTTKSPSTWKRYRAVVDHFQRYLTSLPARRKISDIKVRDIDDFKAWRKQQSVNRNGQPVVPGSESDANTKTGADPVTINFEINTLRTIFNVAIKWGYLLTNPTREVERLKVKKSQVPNCLSQEDCHKLLEASPQPFRDMFTIYLCTGMRLAELTNLEWSDVDFANNIIHIRHKPDWNPKSGERTIPMNSQARAILKSRLPKSLNKQRRTLVFAGNNGMPMTKSVRPALLKAAKEAGLPYLTRVHTLRHTCASLLLMHGKTVFEVKELLGHSDVTTTMIYAHLFPSKLASAVEVLDFSEQKKSEHK